LNEEIFFDIKRRQAEEKQTSTAAALINFNFDEEIFAHFAEMESDVVGT
jgi:hypothetical protein